MYRQLQDLLRRPRPFLLYTESVIYHVQTIEHLDDPADALIPAVEVDCEDGARQKIPLSAIEDIVIQDGYVA